MIEPAAERKRDSVPVFLVSIKGSRDQDDKWTALHACMHACMANAARLLAILLAIPTCILLVRRFIPYVRTFLLSNSTGSATIVP